MSNTLSGCCAICPEILAEPFAAHCRRHNPIQFTPGDSVESKEEWECRQKEIATLLRQYELGTLPPEPTQQRGVYKNGSLTSFATEGQRTISFTACISIPSNCSAPFPAIIAFSGRTFLQWMVLIILCPDAIARQDSAYCGGHGKFYHLYGSNYSARALVD